MHGDSHIDNVPRSTTLHFLFGGLVEAITVIATVKAVGFALLESSRTNADDRLSFDSPGRVEGGDSIVEG